MTLPNPNVVGNENAHRFDGLTVHGGLLLTGPNGVSAAVKTTTDNALTVANSLIISGTTGTATLGVDAGSNLTVNGGRAGGTETDYLNGVIAAGGVASGATVRESIPARAGAFSDLSALADGVMTSVAVVLYAGDVVKNLAFRSGATATNTPVNWWFALYDTNLALLSQTADQLTAAWAANTTKDLALTVQQTITTSGVYYAACMMHASVAVPSLVGETLFNATIGTGLATSQKVLAQTSGSSLTTTAPGTIASPTSVANRVYVVAHS